MDSVEVPQYMLEQIEEISSGISGRDMKKIRLLHFMNKKQLMKFFKDNLEFLETLSVDEITNFIKISMFIHHNGGGV